MNEGGSVEALGDYSKALKFERRDDPPMLQNFANCCPMLGDYKHASQLNATSVVTYQKMIHGSPTLAAGYLRALRNWAEVLIRTGDKVDASKKLTARQELKTQLHLN